MIDGSTQIDLNGEQALARGALAAGVRIAASYPGSPGTGVMNFLIAHASQNNDLYVEWSLNERIALETSIGASIAGQRGLVCVKSVGMNVLLDPLMTLNLTGTHGGLVILLGDDPGAYGSQNEQDTRLMAPLVEIPMLEPAAPVEAYRMIQAAYDLSENLNTAVILRITRSFSQQVEQFTFDEMPRPEYQLGLARQPYRFFPYPGNAVEMHRQLHCRLAAFERQIAGADWDRISGCGKLGVIAAGFVYRKLRDVLGDSLGHDLSVLKLGTLYPLPLEIISRFLARCETVLVLEECDAYVETGIKSVVFDQKLDVEVLGKGSGHLPVGDELLRWQIQAALEKCSPGFQPVRAYNETEQAAERPHKKDHCAASPNERVLRLIKEAAAALDQEPVLIADPGCWVKVPGELDAKYAIGSAVAVASGLARAGVEQRVMALFGDSAFFHSALPAICNAAYQNANLFILLLNNGGAVSTGKQPTPASGVDVFGKPARTLDIARIAKACGVPEIYHLPASAADEEIKIVLELGLSAASLSMLMLDVDLQ